MRVLPISLLVFALSLSAAAQTPAQTPAPAQSAPANAKRIEKLKYIHRNPVTRGLVQRAEDYPWSSFRAYALLEPNPIAITRGL
jgi:hypothetical protein